MKERYKDATDREKIVQEKKQQGLIVTRDHIGAKGNFLEFAKIPRDLEAEIDELKARIDKLEGKTP